MNTAYLILSDAKQRRKKKKVKRQANHRAATETAAFIWVFRFNDQSSFHLVHDFWDEVDAEMINSNSSTFLTANRWLLIV